MRASAESQEMYLESILQLSPKNEGIRSVDLAAFMGFSRASVSRAVALLQEQKLIERPDGDLLYLTKQGLDKAKEIFERHNILTSFFKKLGVDSAIAEEDACRIEHVISQNSFDAIKKFLLGL